MTEREALVEILAKALGEVRITRLEADSDADGVWQVAPGTAMQMAEDLLSSPGIEGHMTIGHVNPRGMWTPADFHYDTPLTHTRMVLMLPPMEIEKMEMEEEAK